MKKMDTCFYPRERVDERLLALRLLRVCPCLLLLVLIGTMLGGGLYYLTHVTLAGPDQYQAKSYFLIHYEKEYEKEGDYYINYYTWNTYLQSDHFLQCLERRLQESGVEMSAREAVGTLTAEVESDIHICDILVLTEEKGLSLAIAEAVERVMTLDMAPYIDQVSEIEILKSTEVEVYDRDVRTGRAFILSAVLSAFSVLVIWLLWENGSDRIDLPRQLRSRYGLAALGTLEDPFLAQNLRHVLGDAESVALLPFSEEVDPGAYEEGIRKAISEGEEGRAGLTITLMPAMSLAPESAESMRSCDALVLLVKAGRGSGKRLERVLGFLETQEIPVAGALLCGEDGWLLRKYDRERKA